MNTYKESLKCKLEQLELYVTELENKLCGYEDVVAQRDALQEKTSTGISMLDKMKSKQIIMFNELINRYNSLYDEYNCQRENLNRLIGENDCLRNENNRIMNKLNEQDVHIENIKYHCTTLKDENHRLNEQCSNSIRNIDNLQNLQRQTEIIIMDKDKKICCAENTLGEKIAQNIELENKIRAEQIKNECLESTMSKIEIKNEKIVQSLKVDLTSVQDQLNKNSIEFLKLKKMFDEKQQECKMLTDELINLKKIINDHQESKEEEKYKFDEEIGGLKAEIESLNTELVLINNKFCYMQGENSKLQSKLEDSAKTCKQLILMEENLQNELKQRKQDVELITQKLMAERTQRTNEEKSHDRKVMLKTQENFELTKLIEDQERQIKRLKMQMADIKPSFDEIP